MYCIPSANTRKHIITLYNVHKINLEINYEAYFVVLISWVLIVSLLGDFDLTPQRLQGNTLSFLLPFSLDKIRISVHDSGMYFICSIKSHLKSRASYRVYTNIPPLLLPEM